MAMFIISRFIIIIYISILYNHNKNYFCFMCQVNVLCCFNYQIVSLPPHRQSVKRFRMKKKLTYDYVHQRIRGVFSCTRRRTTPSTQTTLRLDTCTDGACAAGPPCTGTSRPGYGACLDISVAEKDNDLINRHCEAQHRIGHPMGLFSCVMIAVVGTLKVYYSTFQIRKQIDGGYFEIAAHFT